MKPSCTCESDFWQNRCLNCGAPRVADEPQAPNWVQWLLAAAVVAIGLLIMWWLPKDMPT